MTLRALDTRVLVLLLCFRFQSTKYGAFELFTQPPSGRRRMRICFAVVFLFFLFFFPSTKTMRQPFSGTAEQIFMKLSLNDGGICSLKRRAAAWRKSCRRLANGEC